MATKPSAPKLKTTDLLHWMAQASSSEWGRWQATHDAKYFANGQTNFLHFGLDHALDGDQSFGNEVITAMMWALINGRALVPEERAFLACFLLRITRDRSAMNIGLGVKGAGAARRGLNGLKVAMDMLEILKKGSTIESAYALAAEKNSISPERAKQQWEIWKPRMRELKINSFLRDRPHVSREDAEHWYDMVWFPRQTRSKEIR